MGNAYQSEENNNEDSQHGFEGKLNALVDTVKTLAESQQVVNTQLLSLKETVNSSLNNLSYVPDKSKEMKKDDDWWGGFEADSVNAVKSEVSKTVEKAKQDLKSEWSNELKAKQSQARYDDMALKEYPQLNEPNHPLSNELRKLWNEKLKEDDSWATRPSALYDTARLAFAMLVNRGEIVPEKFKEEARRLISIGDGQLMPMKSAAPQKVEQLTKDQLMWAQKLGVAPAKYLDQLRNPRYLDNGAER